jgi:hypothetical protein
MSNDPRFVFHLEFMTDGIFFEVWFWRWTYTTKWWYDNLKPPKFGGDA